MNDKLYRFTSFALLMVMSLGLLAACGQDETATPTRAATVIPTTVPATATALPPTAVPTEALPTATVVPSMATATPTEVLPTVAPPVSDEPIEIPEGIRSPGFARFYQEVAVRLPASVAAQSDYALPVDLATLVNAERFEFGPEAEALLSQNGFVAVRGDWPEFFQLYEAARYQDLPVFVTTDSVYHVYHLLFDKLLRDLERERLAPAIEALTSALADAAGAQYRELVGTPVEDSARRVWGYFVVAQQLIAVAPPPIPEAVVDEVNGELALIDAHIGIDMSPLLTLPEAFEEGLFCDPDATPEQANKFYCEDYSQYVPRGHYTRDEQLKRYFRAMMWYGRINLRLKHPRETRMALLITRLLHRTTVDGQPAAEVWASVYDPTVFLVGKSDDLSFHEYGPLMEAVYGSFLGTKESRDQYLSDMREALVGYLSIDELKSLAAEMDVDYDALPSIGRVNKVRGLVDQIDREGHLQQLAQIGRVLRPDVPWARAFDPLALADEARLARFIEAARQLPPPQINSMWVYIWEDEEKATQGFRFMGQRFVLDAYIFEQMIWREVGVMGNERWLPKGLDVLAALGNEEAYTILDEMGETAYVNYDAQLEKVRGEIASLEVDSWTQNLYWNWLHALRAVIAPKEEGYPAFMRTQSWARKDLHTALGSWTELKHDTILYAKQVMAELGGGGPLEEPPVHGYVEPNPEAYARLLALTLMTRAGLERGLLTQQMGFNLGELEWMLTFLQDMAERELAGEEITEEEYERIKFYGGWLERITLAAADASEDDAFGKGFAGDEQAALVADVATDPNGMVLEEAIGRIDEIYVVVPDGFGRLQIAKGGLFAYYEFSWPMDDRLTDEAWRDMLFAGEAPDRPTWTSIFIAP
jgi:hypothetical protein